MGNFSRDGTFDPKKHYVGVRLQQGVPVVDADWNEQEDIRKSELHSFLSSVVGSGVPKGNDGFAIHALEPPENDFVISGPAAGPQAPPGRILVDGWEVLNESEIRYTEQALYQNEKLAEKWGVLPLPPIKPTPLGYYHVVLDVWEREVDSDEDPEIVDPRIGLETCVRRRREWVVRLVKRNEVLFPRPGHRFCTLARIVRTSGPVIKEEHISDRRRKGLAVLSEALSIDDQTARVGIGTAEPAASLDITEVPITSGGSPLGSDLWLRAGRGRTPDDGRFWVEYGQQAAPLVVLSDRDDPPRIQFQQTGSHEIESEADPEHKSWIGQARSLSSDIAIMGGNLGVRTSHPGGVLHVWSPEGEQGDVPVIRAQRQSVSWAFHIVGDALELRFGNEPKLRLTADGDLWVPGKVFAGGGTNGAAISISPKPVTLDQAETLQFAAEVTNGAEIVWNVREAEGGIITPAGLYTAPETAGKYHVEAAIPDGTAEAEVTVRPVSVVVRPPERTLGQGQSFKFSSEVEGTVNKEVEWSVVEQGGGSISEEGRYTAPQKAGTFHVRATQVSQPARFGEAAVSVLTVPKELRIEPPFKLLKLKEKCLFTARENGAEVSVTWGAERGSVNPSSGKHTTYTAPNSVCKDTVTATRSGETAEADVRVEREI